MLLLLLLPGPLGAQRTELYNKQDVDDFFNYDAMPMNWLLTARQHWLMVHGGRPAPLLVCTAMVARAAFLRGAMMV
ncbi:hypothetical protein COO60DRAFT_1484593 [Scenedesmus sp. NREL 46B-D3]|nr:hypothetical protein COO60DRAFT_1484593 [Scenedesmus sp. NREL 46B-D3]